MLLSSRQLDAFQVLVRVRHFARAAEALHISQSALSQRIKKLEDTLEEKLFHRGSGELELTDAAFRLVQYCRVRADLESDLRSHIGAGSGQSKVGGVIRLAGFSSCMRSLVYPALANLIRSCTSVRFDLQTRHMFELEESLLKDEADFVVTSEPTSRAGFESLRLGCEQNVLVRGRQANLRNDLYLDHNVHDDFTEQFFSIQGISTGGSLRRSFCADIYGIIDAVAAGLGKGVVPLHMVEHDPRIVVIREAGILETDVNLQFQTREHYSKLHTEVVHALQEGVPRLLQPEHNKLAQPGRVASF